MQRDRKNEIDKILIDTERKIFSGEIKTTSLAEFKERQKEKRKQLYMKRVIFVIGGTASGKSYFIKQHFKGTDFARSDIYDFQQQAYEDAGYGKDSPVPFFAKFNCLLNAQNMHVQDIIDKLKDGKDIVAEQTLFKAKRRITYLDKIKENVENVRAEVYVIMPDDERWEKNCIERQIASYTNYKSQMESTFEFPNPSEGWDAIYVVNGDKISLKMDPPNPDIVQKAREELAEESERLVKEENERQKKEELLESMNFRPFWHYCEVCGKKAYITAQEAHNSGWDYPPNIGYFGFLGPRKCGDCDIKKTLWWKVNHKQKIPLVLENTLSKKELTTWRRIKKEPESLLEERDS